MPWRKNTNPDTDAIQSEPLEEIFCPEVDSLGQKAPNLAKADATNKSCREMLSKVELRQGIRQRGGTPRR